MILPRMNRKLCVTAVVVAGLVAWLAGVWAWKSWSQPHSLFELHGLRGIDAEFSPDGRMLAVVGSVKHSGMPDAVRVFDVATRALVAEPTVDEPLNCAWSADGATLAISRMSRLHVDLWDCNKWTLRKRLEGPDADFTGNLSFDRDGNLFAVTMDLVHERARATAYRTIVWRGAVTGRQEPAAAIATSACRDRQVPAFNVSAVPAEGGVRVAISYEEKCPVKVLAVKWDPTGKLVEEIKCELPDFLRAWVRLTPDGQHLAVLDSERMVFALFRLREDHAEQVVTVPGKFVTSDRGWWEMTVRALDISRDGRLIACRFPDRVKVYRVVDGKEVFDLPGSILSVALSPNGKFLVTCPTGEKRICFYQIPQDGDAGAVVNTP